MQLTTLLLVFILIATGVRAQAPTKLEDKLVDKWSKDNRRAERSGARLRGYCLSIGKVTGIRQETAIMGCVPAPQAPTTPAPKPDDRPESDGKPKT